MDDNQPIQAAVGRDLPRQDAANPDFDYTLTIDEVADRYAHAGHPRTTRTLQRYCVSGHLDARKVATTLGDKYYVAPYSVARHIAQINEQSAFVQRTTSRDLTRHDATVVAQQTQHDDTRHEQPAPIDQPRLVATVDQQEEKKREEPSPRVDRSDEFVTRYVARLESENEFLRDQLVKKDSQIENLSHRFMETQGLLGAVQRMLAPLLGQADPFKKRSGESATNTN